jgi:N-acetylneuraminic acid mutarotase
VLISGGGGFVWVARADGSLARVDPRTGHVVVVQLVNPPQPGWLDVAPAPAGVLSGNGAVWAGNEMVVVGGPGSNAAAAYHPDTDSWTALPPVPGGGRSHPLVLWTGQDVLLWGGAGVDNQPRDDGAAYDPATNRWRKLAPAPSSLTVGIAAVWTGQRLLVWGGTSKVVAGQANLAEMAAYDPSLDRWQALPTPPVALSYAAAVWTGQEAIFWGGVVINRDQGTFVGTDGASFDPATGQWHRLPPSGLDAQASPAAWNGKELVAWSYGLSARAYDPATDTWRAIAPPPLRAGECSSEALPTTLGVFAWYCEQAAVYRANGQWVSEPAPTIDGGTPIWTGQQIVLWGLPPAAGASSTGVKLTPSSS